MRPIPFRQAGFTIMELMITVALAAVLLGVGIPSFRAIMANNRLTTSSNDFVSAINFARSEAIARNIPVTFCRADPADTDECETDDEPWAGWIVIDDEDNVLRSGVIDNYTNTQIVVSDLTNQTLTFGSDGLGRTGGGLMVDSTISICSNRVGDENFRIITIGGGSRVSTTRDTGECS
jgi:type IV fimbrial biogenesis protein FimT